MQYKCTRKGHRGYRLRAKQIKMVRWAIRLEIAFFGVTCLLSVSKRMLNQKEDNNNYVYEMQQENELEEEIEQIVDKAIKDPLNDIKECFIKYCNIYNLDYTFIYSKAYELTNGFTSEQFLNSYNIPGTKVCGKEREFNSLDMGILCFVRHCKQIPEDFGFVNDEIFLKEQYNETSMECEYLVSEYCQNTTYANRELVMAIIYSENRRDLSGRQLTENNNPGCLIDGNQGMNKFKNLEQGLIEQILTLEYKHITDNQLYKLETYNMIEELQKIYAPIEDPKNKGLNINENWSDNVKDIYAELTDDYYSILNERKGLNK